MPSGQGRLAARIAPPRPVPRQGIASMRAVVQRVRHASVTIEGEVVGSIGRGYLVLLGVGHADTRAEADKLWNKIFALRINDDEDGKTNLALAAVSYTHLDVYKRQILYAQWSLGCLYK